MQILPAWTGPQTEEPAELGLKVWPHDQRAWTWKGLLHEEVLIQWWQSILTKSQKGLCTA